MPEILFKNFKNLKALKIEILKAEKQSINEVAI